MRETYDFRIPESHAQRYLKPDDGKVIGFLGELRQVVLDSRDPRMEVIRKTEQAFRKRGESFHLGWTITRKYTEKELEAAELFYLFPRATFEPVGESCGTEYDDAAACQHCGAHAPQRTELRLDTRRLPRGRDIAKTIAYSEVVVSARLVEAFQKQGFTGARFLPIRSRGGRNAIDSWFQLSVESRPLGVAPQTRFGVAPFDEDEKGEYRCPKGHVLGLNLLSEVWVKREDWDGADVCATKQWVGMRSRDGGVFRPHPLLLISQRMRGLLTDLKAKGHQLEVAHLV
jgi:hypothetical protein